MKLFVKIFMCSIAVIAIAVASVSYSMISNSFYNTLQREKERAIEEYQLLKFNLQAGILNANERGEDVTKQLYSLARSAAMSAPPGNNTAVYNEDLSQLYSNFREACGLDGLDGSGEEIVYSVERRNAGCYINISGRIEQNDTVLYLVSSRNINSVVNEKITMQREFIVMYIITLCVSCVIMLLLSRLLTLPIKQLTWTTRRIASGYYGERTKITSRDETGELSRSFNIMAEALNEKIDELKLKALQQSDFSASFAHEIKTPLTSVIGFADMIYQERLSDEEVRRAAGYIVDEGMRLEALSIKLMEFIVLERKDFVLVETCTSDIFEDIRDSMAGAVWLSNVNFTAGGESEYIAVEYDLLKTLIINLIDNAVKYGSSNVEFGGCVEDGKFVLFVQDDGKGIPEEELSRITEAFYMVDKSRSCSRKGVGLGLSIASKVAELHGSKLEFTSEPGKGTRVSLRLDIVEGEDEQ